MREIGLPPNAPALLASLRAIGYSYDSALADIIDNSLTAGASRIDVQFRPGPRMYVAVIDDGCGMSPDGILAAMQHGGVGPNAERAPDDLGRFGLGLKTASLSQCKRLSVASLRGGELSGAVWDLDRIEETGDWTLQVLEASEVDVRFPHVERLRAAGHGTIVLWEEFDRALAGEAEPADALGVLMDKARLHLGLVFHRWIKPEAGQARIELRLNDSPISATDPFLVGDSSVLPSQPISVEGWDITLTPYILPHRSRLTRAQLAAVDGEGGLRRTQGFYVYRSRRLITSGTWFRLMRQGELTKLARVRVDIPNALDHLWQLDVKKSTARPPQQVRLGLMQIVEKIGGTSTRVYTHRGWKDRGEITRLWDRLDAGVGVNYQVNREHPAVAAIAASLPDDRANSFDRLLTAIERALPFDAIYADIASEREVRRDAPTEGVEDELRSMLDTIVAAASEDGEVLDNVLTTIPLIEPFSQYPELTRRLIEETRHA